MSLEQDVKEAYRGIDLLDKSIFYRGRQAWLERLETGAADRGRAVQDLIERRPRLAPTGRAVVALTGPVNEILAKVIAGGKPRKPRSWREIHPRAAGEIERVAERCIYPLAKYSSQYGVIAEGLMTLVEKSDPKIWESVAKGVNGATGVLCRQERPFIWLGVDDWWVNPKRRADQGLVVVEPEVTWGVSAMNESREREVRDLKRWVGELHHRSRPLKGAGIIFTFLGGGGGQHLSVSSGLSWDDGGGFMLAENIQKTRPVVEAGLAAAGYDPRCAGKNVERMYVVHESAHPYWKGLPSERAELGPDLDVAKVMAQAAAGWGGARADRKLGEVMEVVFWESVAQALEPRTGAANNDGYPYSGERGVSMMVESGVMKVDEKMAAPSPDQLGAWLGQVTRAQRALKHGDWRAVDNLGRGWERIKELAVKILHRQGLAGV